MVILEVEHLKKTYTTRLGSNRVEALRDVNFNVEQGEFVAIMGESGSGKTTLLNLLAALDKPTGGQIRLNGKNLGDLKEKEIAAFRRENLGFVFQDFALWPHMSVFENVAFGLRAQHKTQNLSEDVLSALKTVQLEGYEQRYPHELSGGQQQRVAFARAMVINPDCILFDEPLSALDALLRESMRFEIRRIVSERKITSIFVTHDQLEAMSMSDEIIVMNDGEIAQQDTPENLYNHPQNHFVANFIGKSNWLSNTDMIRPEKLSIDARGRLEMKVAACQFMGSSYEVLLEHGDQPWILLSDYKMNINEMIRLNLNENAIIQLRGEEQ